MKYLILIMCIFMGGCTSTQSKIVDNSYQLQIGMTKNQVRSLMGDPDRGVTQAYNLEIWNYSPSTVITFDNGNLILWAKE